MPNLNSNFLLPVCCPGAKSFVHQRQLNQSIEEIRRLGIIFELEGRKFFSGPYRNEEVLLVVELCLHGIGIRVASMREMNLL